MTQRLTRNAARCPLCDTVIESRHRHDFNVCPCGALSVDGGLAYLKRSWDESRLDHNGWDELSEWSAPAA